MSDAAASLPTTLVECHAKIVELSAEIATLQAVNARLEAIIVQQQITIDEQQSQLRSLKQDVALMKRTLFGQRRERFENDPQQKLLFESVIVGGPEQAATSDGNGVDSNGEDKAGEDSSDDDGNVDERQGSSKQADRGRRVMSACLPRIQRVHELDTSQIPEHQQGEAGRRFLKKVGEHIEWEPPRLTVIEEFVEVLALDNDDATETTMLSARRPPRIINSFAGPSLLAALAVNRFADHLPYYRLEEILGRSHLTIDRGTQCRWMIRLAKKLTPLTDLMRRLVLQSRVVQADETPVRMLAPGTGKTATTYLWAVLGDQQHPYTTFSFTESRARAGPAEFFADFAGVLVSDAYTGYEFLNLHSQGQIRLACCHAHARRKFEELHALGPTERTTTAMSYFQRLYDIEDELRDLSDDARHAQRQFRSRPLLNEFRKWLDEQLATLRPKHELRGAITYMTTRWECFERFLESGAIPVDNNASEQAVKNPVMGKKAWQFFGSPTGGHAAAVLYTLTATCRRLKIDSFAYLKDVFERLPELMRNAPDPASSLTPLLPDLWLAEHPNSRLENRINESSLKSTRRRQRRKQRRTFREPTNRTHD